MRLQKPYIGGTNYSIEDAVESQVDDWGHSGEIESLRRKLDNLAVFTGRLLNLLHDNGTVNKDEVLGLLPSFEELKEK